ncbi:MAG TPA: CDP-alcohol phosphatidyltransferase family protein [Terriglobales bacterium]|nr:CDP-alcohol phosphatidyltransferase family protein [Terriglobales bacterium]
MVSPSILAPAETRISHALTADAERRLLIWIARRLPEWVHSDLLTLLGLGGQLAAGISYGFANGRPWCLILVDLFLAINWFGDSLDGTVARVRDRQRPKYGYYVDHVCDIFGSTALMVGLAVSGLLHWQVAIALQIGFLILASESFLATFSLGRFELSRFGLGPTELRILLCVGNLAVFASPYASVGARRFLLFDLGGIIGAAGMLGLAVMTAVRHAAELRRGGV